MGKGSVPRPFEVPREQYRDNFDRIFGKKDKQDDKPKNDTPVKDK